MSKADGRDQDVRVGIKGVAASGISARLRRRTERPLIGRRRRPLRSVLAAHFGGRSVGPTRPRRRRAGRARASVPRQARAISFPWQARHNSVLRVAATVAGRYAREPVQPRNGRGAQWLSWKALKHRGRGMERLNSKRYPLGCQISRLVRVRGTCIATQQLVAGATGGFDRRVNRKHTVPVVASGCDRHPYLFLFVFLRFAC